jgi:hypothetical protein
MSYKHLIYDEEEIGKSIYEKGCIESINWIELLALSKYIKKLFGCGDDRLKTLLNEFLSKTPYYNKVRMRPFIGKIIKNTNNEFIRTGCVSITEIELRKIREIKNFKDQKIALGILFVSKRKNNNGYVKTKDWKDIKISTSTSRIRTLDIQRVFFYMYNNNFNIRVGEGFHQILFANKDSAPIINITDDRSARNLGNLYKSWCGGELGYCKDCNSEFIKTGRTHYYCDEHSKERKKENGRYRAKKYRKNKT